VQHSESALALVDPVTDPLSVCRILLSLHFQRDLAGLGPDLRSLTEPTQALALTEGLPPCPERAIALAQLAYAEWFNGHNTAASHAQAAVSLAQDLNDEVALSWALSARAQTRCGTSEGIADALEALALSQEVEPGRMLERATNSLSNSYQSAGQWAAAAQVTEASYSRLRDAGCNNEAAMIGFLAAQWNLEMGRWDRVRSLVRQLFVLARSPSVAASARCIAARLTALEGNGAAALLHLRRATELMPVSAPVGDDVVPAQIQVSIILGNPRSALQVVEATMAEAVQVDPIAADEWLQWAARAAMDLAEQGDSDQSRGDAVAWLERIESLHGDVTHSFEATGPLDAIHPALGALFAAQRAECLRNRGAVARLWADASWKTEQAGMRYEHARSLYFRARALLEQRHHRHEAIEAPTKARAIAVDLGAMPLIGDVDALAAQVHASLAAVVDGPDLPALAQHGFGVNLTPREREILGGIIAGETYGQIASRLYISDKTVSSHVSNLLRKTGTTSRIELSALARRFRDNPS
jgi:DNA-binding CsgD family transcriptional regulator